jgi:hypothetical protein
VLEREFDRAEKIEERRQSDEMEMRYRVQRKRFNELERVRKEEILHKLKHDRDLSKEIINTMRGSSTNTNTNSVSLKKGGGGSSRGSHGSAGMGMGMGGSLSTAGSQAITPFDRAAILEDSQYEGEMMY